ncbi:unnamed protein product [Brassica oleracea var. botrytis]
MISYTRPRITHFDTPIKYKLMIISEVYVLQVVGTSEKSERQTL